jgi:hypothetical protein
MRTLEGSAVKTPKPKYLQTQRRTRYLAELVLALMID